MKNTVLLSTIILAFMLFSCSQAFSAMADRDNRRDMVEEEIWALEEAYFTNLYRANYDGVLAIVHNQFLGWPGNVPQPIDKEESARFMKQLIPKPTPCTLKIERSGIRLLGEVALTQYILHVNCSDNAGVEKKQSSRITHTWVKEGVSWKLLGGMSYDK
ncbi:MAG: nuclear transport factor 2 family protein [Proteobacteria bacterium]|nr:nuclear transport factor 2 family protein [Pseudomonadota bacterium]